MAPDVGTSPYVAAVVENRIARQSNMFHRASPPRDSFRQMLRQVLASRKRGDVGYINYKPQRHSWHELSRGCPFGLDRER
jgi:hypothetical protein